MFFRVPLANRLVREGRRKDAGKLSQGDNLRHLVKILYPGSVRPFGFAGVFRGFNFLAVAVFELDVLVLERDHGIRTENCPIHF